MMINKEYPLETDLLYDNNEPLPPSSESYDPMKFWLDMLSNGMDFYKGKE